MKMRSAVRPRLPRSLRVPVLVVGAVVISLFFNLFTLTANVHIALHWSSSPATSAQMAMPVPIHDMDHHGVELSHVGSRHWTPLLPPEVDVAVPEQAASDISRGPGNGDGSSQEPRASDGTAPDDTSTDTASKKTTPALAENTTATTTAHVAESSSQIVPYLPVCAFANAESISTALETAAQWPHFPFWFAVWREPIEYQVHHTRIHMIPAQNSTHAAGWEMAVAQAKASGFLCEFYFAMDDDLTWNVTEAGRQSLLPFSDAATTHHKLSITSVLMQYLHKYRPALTVFPWPWGDANHANMTRMNELYAGQLVQPATGFDNGCMIFHHTVVDFFVPVWLGRSFQPKFIVQHTFQNYFAPFLLRGNAIRFNGVAYVNPPVQRHPYDLPFEYMDYLLPASRCEHARWGPYLAPEDVYWTVEMGQPPYRFDDINYMATFFDISHSAIRDHPALQQRILSVNIDIVQERVHQLLTQEEFCTGHARAKLPRRASALSTIEPARLKQQI